MKAANRKTELIKLLSRSKQSIPSSTLAGLLGVSERTVRNYIKEIISEGRADILASRDGYLLRSSSDSGKNREESQSEAEIRVYRVLSDLLTNKDGFNAFDEAELLYVSASTIINTIIPKIKNMIREYDLTVESQKYQFVLVGSEQNKRKLIGHIATNSSYGFFNTQEALEQLFPDQDIHDVMQKLYETCQESSLFLNDYSLNNLLIHILVILIRIESDNTLENSRQLPSADTLLDEFSDKDEIITLADRISSTFKDEYGILIPENDYQQLLILIALSVEHGTADIQTVITPEFVNNIISILSVVSMRYCLPEFTNDFAMQFSLHMYYARQRYKYQITCPNPIGVQFKKDYAPVFDMAVYFSHKFDSIYHTELTEDEIAFIAFHFGSFLENSKQSSGQVSCIVIAESYHLFVKKLIRDIEDNFSKKLIVLDVLPLNRYLEKHPACDLLITTIPLVSDRTDCPVIQVNPILTRKNTYAINTVVEELLSKKEQKNALEFLQKLLHRELYFRNVSLDTADDYIKFMGHQCMDYGYVNEEFIQDVLLRESVSCTAFTDTLAIPHSISRYADKSFICVVHNDQPIQWNMKTVHFVFMIGIAEQDMKYFRAAFDLIVDLFNSAERTYEILKTKSFEEFYDRLR